jgi:hypothetical protein
MIDIAAQFGTNLAGENGRSFLRKSWRCARRCIARQSASWSAANGSPA